MKQNYPDSLKERRSKRFRKKGKLVKFLKMVGMVGIILSAHFHSVSTACASGNENEKVLTAAEVLVEIMEITDEGGVPRTLLNDAYGIMVIPDVLKVGYVIGGRHGKGILVTRTEDDTWSNPVFVELRAGSVGWQIGIQSTDLVLLFDSRSSVSKVIEGEFTLGADASVSAGPKGRGVGAQTDVEFESEIYSYSKSRGLFAGVSLEGASIQIDYTATENFYGDAYTSVRRVLDGDIGNAPDSAEEFLSTLNRYVKPE
ncbi:MAG: hypothetical protein GF372_07700 [Candidatus Marinimicrobia bacterium]|nr:hypothetical protein [Candidatus Neomarinimicrobiota bacterium]